MAESNPVDEYIASFDDWRGEVMDELRGLVTNAAPSATVGIKWAQPVFELEGPFAYMKAHGRHITFGFWRGVELEDPKDLLKGAGVKMRHVKISETTDVKTAAFRAFVRQAVRLNREHGDPTRRAD
jgi:hypothetical protein